jgi:hypothetical protein
MDDGSISTIDLAIKKNIVAKKKVWSLFEKCLVIV